MDAVKKNKSPWIEHNSNGRLPGGKITLLLAFAIPAVLYLIIYIVDKISPFGELCYLRSDMYHQYAPFFAEFRRKLLEGGSLSYTWAVGMGTNFTSLYAYYLASPINWLLFLVPQESMIEVMNFIMVSKCCLASLTMTYYLIKRFNYNSISMTVFGVFYAMSGYIAAYNWNIMWLDCIWLLPLIIYGLERLVKDNKGIFYSVVLGICIFSNYYISIMICIALVLYFITLLFSCDYERTPDNVLKKCGRFALYSCLAGGIAACMILPEMYTLSLTSSANNEFPQMLSEYFSFFKMLVRHLVNVPVHIGLEHLPNIYCGIGVLMLVPLYVMNPKISKREKIGKMVVILILLLSFNLDIPNYIWHGFHFPNSLPARNSFIYIFFVLIIAYDAFKDLREYENHHISKAFWIPLAVIIIFESMFASETYNFKIFYISGLYLLIYGLLIVMHRNKKIPNVIVAFLFFAVTVIEATVNMAVTGFELTSRVYYTSDNATISALLDDIDNNDDSFHRVEKLYGRITKNDGTWNGYDSVSCFSSTANDGIATILRNLGMQSSANSFSTNGGTALTYSLFGVKYYLSNTPVLADNFTSYYNNMNSTYVYRNDYVLPIGYCVPNTLNSDWATDLSNSIAVQNDFASKVAGVPELFNKLPIFISEASHYFQPGVNGHLYGYTTNSNLGNVSIVINNSTTYSIDCGESNFLIDFGYVNADDSINVSANSSLSMQLYILNDNAFKTTYNKLKANSLNVTAFSDTAIEGSIDVDKDSTLMFAIAYDKGWTLKVDGNPVDTYALKNAFVAADIPAGHHEISLSYSVVGFAPGILITFISIAILIIIYLCKYKGLINKLKSMISGNKQLDEKSK